MGLGEVEAWEEQGEVAAEEEQGEVAAEEGSCGELRLEPSRPGLPPEWRELKALRGDTHTDGKGGG